MSDRSGKKDVFSEWGTGVKEKLSLRLNFVRNKTHTFFPEANWCFGKD